MALAALSPVMLVEGLLVFAAIEKTGVGRVADTAAAANRGDARRKSRVISVTIVTGWSAQVGAFEKGATVHAGLKLCQLRGRKGGAVRERKTGHCLRIGVTRAACFRHPLSIDL